MQITFNGVTGDAATVKVKTVNGQNENRSKSSWQKRIQRTKKPPTFHLLSERYIRSLKESAPKAVGRKRIQQLITPVMAAMQLMRLSKEVVDPRGPLRHFIELKTMFKLLFVCPSFSQVKTSY